MAKPKQPKNTVDTKDNTEEVAVSRSPRAAPMARAGYRDPNSIEIPLEMAKAFEKDGYFLRWVRIVDAGTKQATNERVNYFLTIGGEIVTPQEIKKIAPSFLTGLTKYEYREDFVDEDDDRGRGGAAGIKKGQLMLMKIPLEYRTHKQKENREMVEEQLTAAQHEYKREGGSDVFVEKFKHGQTRVQVKGDFFE